MKFPTKDTQQGLEELFSKHQLLPVLRAEFQQMGDDCGDGCEPAMATEALAQLFLHRQADVPTMVGILSPKFGTPQEVADKLLHLCQVDYFDFQESSGKFIVKYDVSEDVQDMLEKYQYPLPMVTAPRKVTKNFHTGYETILGSAVLNGSEYFEDKDICLDHLNRANSVALSLDIDVITSPEGKYLRPTRNNGEDFVEFRKRQKQADTFYTSTLDVMETLIGLSDELYMTHKYDRRGRCYSSGYHVNPQGTDYNKAVLQLANKEVII